MDPIETGMGDPYGGGLAAQAAGGGNPYEQSPQMPDPSGGGAGDRQALLDEVVRLLMSGVDPEEIAAQGVPFDIIEEAMRQVMAQAGDPGLAPDMSMGEPMPGGMEEDPFVGGY